MAGQYDVVVIGGGLSGFVAAATAGRMGKRVMLLTDGIGSFPFLPGFIDLWGYQPGKSGLMAGHPEEEIDRYLATDPEHPYGKLREILKDSLESFRQICQPGGGAFSRPDGDNITVPTPVGMPRPAYLATRNQYLPGWQNGENILVVGLAEYRDFFPALVAGNLTGWKPKSSPQVLFHTATLGLGRHVDSYTLANCLEREKYQDVFVNAVAPKARGFSLVLVPAVFGLESADGVLSSLSQRVGTPLMEVATLPPSVPGLRIYRALRRHLRLLGVIVAGNMRVSGADFGDGECLAVRVAGGGRERTYSARSFILATGSFVSSGFVTEGDEIIEPVMHLPVWGRADRRSPADEPFFSPGGKSFMRAGIRVDENLNPLDRGGRVIYRNVFVTGTKLAGFDYSVEKSGTGIAVASGYKAASLA